MKHLISMPSTKAAEFLYTDFSTIPQQDNPKTTLLKLISYIKNVLKSRVYLCERDMQQFFTIDPSFFSQYLHVDSYEELWKFLSQTNHRDGVTEKLQERQMLSMFTKIIIQFTKFKNNCGFNKKFETFAMFKNIIQWLQQEIVGLETNIRDSIKENAFLKLQMQRKNREKQFSQFERKNKQNIQFQTTFLQEDLQKRQKNENKKYKTFINAKVQEEQYLHKASKKLSQAKDLSLLAKLAPFKSEKKRSYECKVLQNSLQTKVKEDKIRMKQQIESYKKNERQKLKKKQQLQKNVYLDRIQLRNQQALSKLQNKREQIHKSQKIKLYNLVGQNDKITRERVKSLRNSLRTYRKHDQTRQIGKVMQTHKQTIQFVQNVQEIGQTTLHQTLRNRQQMQPKYTTIDNRDHLKSNKESKRYSDAKIEKNILKKIKREKNYSTLDTNQLILKTGQRQKSLADLYNDNLQQC